MGDTGTLLQVFDCLPAAALVGKELFCVHGGLSPHLERPQDVNQIQRPCKIASTRGDLLSDLVWSDPNGKVKGALCTEARLDCPPSGGCAALAYSKSSDNEALI